MEVIHAQNRTEEFLRGLDKRVAVKVDKLLMMLARDGNKISFSKSRHIRDGIFELRVVGERQIRIFCTFHNGEAYILHIFIKKT
jgi:phage-related protein